MRADQPACPRGAGDLEIARAAAGLDQQPRRTPLPRGQNQPARGGEIAGTGEPGHFCENRVETRAAQPLLHRPERAAGIAGTQHDDAGGIKTGCRIPSSAGRSRHHGKPLRIGRPVLGAGALLLDPEHRPAAMQPQGEREGKTMRGPAIAGLFGEDLMHGPPGKPAAEHRVDRVMIERGVVG